MPKEPLYPHKRKEVQFPHVPKSREHEGWVYVKVGTTEVRGRKVPYGMDIEQVSPTFNRDDFDKAVRIIEEKLSVYPPLYDCRVLPQALLIEGGEPVPDKYKWLIPFIGDEPLPLEANILLPAVEVAEGERKIDAVLKRLAEAVEGIQDSTQFRLFLTTMAKFHSYSYSNQILIMLQKPNATHVAGFVTWKSLERWVRSGEKGIAILAPFFLPRATCPKCGAKITKNAQYCPKCGEPVEVGEIEVSPRGYFVANVFDISQTEGKPLPEFEVPVLTGEANEELFADLLALMKRKSIQVNFDSRPQLDPSIKGHYLHGEIWVRPEEARAQQLKTLTHEVAHHYSEDVFHIPRRDAETIAESAAYVVGAHYGFDTGVRSFPYVALWAQDKKVLNDNITAIHRVVTAILKDLGKTEEG